MSLTKVTQSMIKDAPIDILNFGADPTGVSDSSAAIQAAINSGTKSIFIPEGVYLCNVTLSDERVIFGEGTTRSILKPFNSSEPVITYRTPYQDWSYCTELRNLGFVSASKTGIGFCYGPADPANYTVGDELVLPVTFRNCLFDNFDKGVLSNYGNIGIDFYSCGFRNNNYGCYFLGDYYASMHAGNKYFYGGEMHGNNCAVYVNNKEQTGSVTFKSTILQYNRIAFYCYSTGSVTPHQFIDVWQEGNGIAGSFPSTTTIDTYNASGVKSTKTIDTFGFVIEGSKTKIIVQGGQLNNWNLIGGDHELNAYGCIANSDRVDPFYPNCNVVNDTSSIYLRDCFSTFGYPYGKNIYAIGMAKTHTQVISSVANDGEQRWMTVPHRKIIIDDGVTPNAGVAIPCDTGATFVQMTTAETITGGVVTDGPTFKFANEFVGTQPAKTNYRLNGSASNITTTAGYYVFSVAIKQALSSNAYFNMWSFNTDYFATLIQPPPDNKWYTYAAIGYSSGGQTMYLDAFMDDTSVFRIQAYQVRRFDTYQDAQEFVSQGIYIAS